jgi:hypothetical protein
MYTQPHALTHTHIRSLVSYCFAKLAHTGEVCVDIERGVLCDSPKVSVLLDQLSGPGRYVCGCVCVCVCVCVYLYVCVCVCVNVYAVVSIA